MFSNRVSQGTSTVFQGRLHAQSSWPTQNGFYGIFVDILLCFCFVLEFCLFVFLPACFVEILLLLLMLHFFKRENETIKLNGLGGREDLGGVGGEDNMIKIHCMKLN